MHIHEEVLAAANQVASHGDGTFRPSDIVERLPHLNERSVRTHVVSRCCVNAPANHLHRWDYFRRVGHGKYRIEPKYRRKPASKATMVARVQRELRDTLHAIVRFEGGMYVVECFEAAIVTQGHTLDEAAKNLREAVSLYFEDEDSAVLGFVNDPRIQILHELQLRA